MTKLEQAARQLLEIAVGIQYGTDWNNGTHAKIYRPKFPAAITALREVLEQLNCQCGDKCFPVFSGDIEYCETCGKPTALAEQVHTPYCKQAPMCKTPCGNSDCVEQAEQEPVPDFPEPFTKADIGYVQCEKPQSWSDEHFETWQRLQVAERNKTALHKYARKLKQRLMQAVKQEPVAVVGFDTQSWRNLVDALTKLPDGTKLYAEPANKTEEKPLLVQAWEKRFAEQAEQEQVAVLDITYGREPECYATPNADDLPEGTYRLYAAPVRTKDLTDDELNALDDANWDEGHKVWDVKNFARAVIAADREKNK